LEQYASGIFSSLANASKHSSKVILFPWRSVWMHLPKRRRFQRHIAPNAKIFVYPLNA